MMRKMAKNKTMIQALLKKPRHDNLVETYDKPNYNLPDNEGP
jgi:hypothetical protein